MNPIVTEIQETRRVHRSLLPSLLGLTVFSVLWFYLCRQLSNEWSNNEQYSYGWFVPFFALFLFWLRWESRPPPAPITKRERNRILLLVGIPALLLLLPIRVFEIGIPDWRPLGWFHAAAVVGLTLLAVCVAGGIPWLRHFWFPVAFIFVAVPWIKWIEVRVVLRLMRGVAAVATETLSLAGIPAQLEGNLIRVSTGVVGMSEACSGVRSLQTALMIGLLFGELKRFNFARRVVLIIAAAAIAMAANLGRTIFLVWVAADRGIVAVGQWHDFAGYSIVVVVFAGCLGVAAWLGKTQSDPGNEKAEKGERNSPHPNALPQEEKGTCARQDESALNPQLSTSRRLHLFSGLFSTGQLVAILCWLGLIELGAEAWYRSHETNLVRRIHWTVRLPESAPGFRKLSIDDFTRETLRFDEGRAAFWRLHDAETSVGPPDNSSREVANAPAIYLYFFRWQSGRSSILRARAHRPDNCLPSIGWKATRDGGTRMYSTAELSLPFRHFEFTRRLSDSQPALFAHAFYCVRADWIKPGDEGSRDDEQITGRRGYELTSDFLRVVREGVRERGQQVMEVSFVSTQPIAPEKAQSQFAQLVREIVVVHSTEQPTR